MENQRLFRIHLSIHNNKEFSSSIFTNKNMRTTYGVESDLEIRDIEAQFLDLLGAIFLPVRLVVVDEFFRLFDGGRHARLPPNHVFLYGLQTKSLQSFLNMIAMKNKHLPCNTGING